jgi:hypothetical protein
MSAATPDIIGVAAEVPEKPDTQPPDTKVVTYAMFALLILEGFNCTEMCLFCKPVK